MCSIPRNTLARASFRCGAFARSLLHWEGHLREHPADLQHTVDTLQHVYGALQEQVRRMEEGREGSGKELILFCFCTMISIISSSW